MSLKKQDETIQRISKSLHFAQQHWSRWKTDRKDTDILSVISWLSIGAHHLDELFTKDKWKEKVENYRERNKANIKNAVEGMFKVQDGYYVWMEDKTQLGSHKLQEGTCDENLVNNNAK